MQNREGAKSLFNGASMLGWGYVGGKLLGFTLSNRFFAPAVEKYGKD
jgi:hypothetical protein